MLQIAHLPLPSGHLRAHSAHTATRVFLHCVLLHGLLQARNAPLGFETKCCAPAGWWGTAQDQTREHRSTQNEKITIHTNHQVDTRYIAGVGPLNNINERGPHLPPVNVQSSVLYNNPNQHCAPRTPATRCASLTKGTHITTCKLCKLKSPDCRANGVKTKPRNCSSWTGCIKHMENIHYLLDRKDLEAAPADPKAHWDSLEESKVGKRGIETRYQRQSTVDDCVEEFGNRSAETRRCVANLAHLCAVENLHSHMGTRAGFVKFMRQWELGWPSIPKQSVTRSVEKQSRALWADIKCEML